ncbi:glycosyltransferase family 2 protein [Actinomyces wuliandei]|uniref:glycosyltransferase family 2 protein n=1 Tax=Actinomyces wuliandei TaxID=2057743 RepID=UPI000FD83ACD|nr:glycosyltransferase [Actinomyces wuliandei]
MSGVTVIVADGVWDARRERPEGPTGATVESFRQVASDGDRLLVGSWWGCADRVETDYALLLRAGDTLEPGALRALEEFARARRVRLVTADRIEDGQIRRCQRWSPALFEQFPYTGRLMLVEASVLAQVVDTALQEPLSEWDMQLRLVDAAAGADHCPVVAVNQATPVRAGGLADRVTTVQAHLARAGRSAELVSAGPTGMPQVRARTTKAHLVSVIVPTAFSRRELEDGTVRTLVECLLTGILVTVGPRRCEVVLVVDDQADSRSVERCRSLWPGTLRVVTTRGPFNFSAAVNAGAAASRGEVLLLLNDDVEPCHGGWLDQMLGVLERPGTAVVGARLLLGDGRIQHLGVVCPPGGLPMHPRVFEEDRTSHPMAQADVEYLAVTGACLMCRREDFEAVGGMDERLPLNFNDIDLCLRMVARGGSVVCVNSVRMVHRESSTRRPQILPEERAAVEGWYPLTATDPHIEYWG